MSCPCIPQLLSRPKTALRVAQPASQPASQWSCSCVALRSTNASQFCCPNIEQTSTKRHHPNNQHINQHHGQTEQRRGGQRADKRAKASEEPDMSSPQSQAAALQLQIDRMKAENERHKAELAERRRDQAEKAGARRKGQGDRAEALQTSHSNTSSSTSPGTAAASLVRAAFSQTFVDPNGIVKSLIRHIDSVAKDWPCTQNWIAPLIVLVQGSGMGKSRSMREVANSRFSVYVCLRGASEVAYPHRSFITDTFLRTPPENFTYFCVQFIAGCMFHLQEAIQESITEWMRSDGKSNLLTPESFIKPQLIDEGGQPFWETILKAIAKLENKEAFSNLQKVSPTGSFPPGITPTTDQPKPGESGDAPSVTVSKRRQQITAYFHLRADKLKDAIQSLSICQIRTALDREQFDMDKLRSILDQYPYKRLLSVLETLCSSSFDSVSELGNITALCDALKNNDMEQLADALKNNNMEQLAVALESFASACQAAMIFSFDEVASLLVDCGCTEPSVCIHKTGRLNQLREVLGCLPKTTSHAIVSVWADTSIGVFYWDVISAQDRFCMAHHVIDDWVGRHLSLRVETLQMSSDLQMKIWTSLLLLGRPLWRTVELGPPEYGFPILINTALLKMCHSTGDPFSLLDGTGAAGSRHAYLAMANARLCLKTVGSFELTSTMTAKYMAVCTSISPSRDAMEISYLSDPIFAEAGASAMNGFRWLMLVRHLCTAVQNGSMSGGDRGELVARILLLMAMDSSRSSPGVCKRTMPVTVKAFLGYLFGPKAVSAMLDGSRAHLEGDGVRTTGTIACSCFTCSHSLHC
ncbi:hypothetical protein BC831DRAFT_442041 [Entophlyctis helioformis]|nr:hypothetical protein BC831DRAFT_442041 [Entophlyctis helioformis]